MAPFDDLPADQKAVLQLVLRQGRTYSEIAGLLKISPEAVRDRALTALDAIGPNEVDGLDADGQDEVGDYLLGQQGASARAATRETLERSAGARTWARAVAGELRAAGLAEGDDALPEIPADQAEVGEAFDALDARRRARAEQERSSRLGGVLLLFAAGLAVAAIIIVILNVTGGSDKKDKASATTPATTAQTQTTTGTQVESQVNLNPPNGAKSPLGALTVVTQDGQRALAVVGQGLAPSGHYVLWLRNGNKLKFMGFFPVVAGSGTDKGKLQGLVAAPADLANYSEVLVSREPSSKPTQPTNIVLQGQLKG